MSRRHVLPLLLSLALAACASGAPPGFSGGDSWAFPLVGPLENGALLTPVTIGDRGPYLFLIDPDASMSSIDERLASELDLYTGMGPRLIDEHDTSHPMKIAEVPAMTVGTLTVKSQVVTLHPVGTYFTEGREVRGVLGGDVIAESLVFGFDRDAGMAYLATHDVFTPPDGSIKVPYRLETMREDVRQRVARRVARVSINGHEVNLHLDLGAVPSQLRASAWEAAKLAPVPFKVQLVDEVGTPRDVDKGGIANQVTAGGASAMGLTVVPYADQRFDVEDVDGALGLDFFASYVVWADWHGKAFYLVPRDGEAERREQRLTRWGATELAACAAPACTTARLVPAAAAAPPADAAEAPAAPAAEPAAVLEVTREPAASGVALEVLLDTIDADGQPLGLPRLVATFARGATRFQQGLPPAYAGARFRPVDLSPFVRPCPGEKPGCVYELRR